jgi:dolichol-phosphate mannosyltransferase
VGFKQTGVDHVRPERAFGRSTHSFLKNVWWAKKAIISFSFAPIELLGYVAATLTALSFCALVYQGIDVLRRPEAAHGTSTVIVLVVFFGSLQLLAIALIGEYLIKIFEETKRRPKFIRRAVRHRDRHFTTAAEIDAFQEERMRARGSSDGARREADRG